MLRGRPSTAVPSTRQLPLCGNWSTHSTDTSPPNNRGCSQKIPKTVLAVAYHGLGTLAVLLSPILPTAAAKLWSALGAAGLVQEQRIDRAYQWSVGTRVAQLAGLFPRIEAVE